MAGLEKLLKWISTHSHYPSFVILLRFNEGWSSVTRRCFLVGEAARLLGMAKSTLFYRLKKNGLI